MWWMRYTIISRKNTCLSEQSSNPVITALDLGSRNPRLNPRPSCLLFGKIIYCTLLQVHIVTGGIGVVHLPRECAVMKTWPFFLIYIHINRFKLRLHKSMALYISYNNSDRWWDGSWLLSQKTSFKEITTRRRQLMKTSFKHQVWINVHCKSYIYIIWTNFCKGPTYLLSWRSGLWKSCRIQEHVQTMIKFDKNNDFLKYTSMVHKNEILTY